MTPSSAPTPERPRRWRAVAGLLAVLGAVLWAAGCREAGPAPALADGTALVAVRLQTDWFPQPEHGGYYQALARGFYREAGLAVEIVPGGPNVPVLESVALGRSDLGMTNGDNVMVAVGRGLPLVIVAAEMQRDPQGILFHAEHPLRDFRDLDGRTLMAGPGSAFLEYLQRRHGIRFNLVPLTADLTSFLADTRALRQCFVTNEPFFARQQGVETGTLLIASAGYEPYRVIFTSREFLSANRETVRRFVAATVRGWEEFMAGDPEPAAALIRARNRQMSPEFITFSRQALADYGLVVDAGRGERVGLITPERIGRQLALLRELGILPRDLAPADVADFTLLPPP